MGVSAQRAGQEMLRHSHQFWQATLDTLPIGLAIVNQDGRVVACNAAWRAQNWCGHQCELGQSFNFDLSLSNRGAASLSRCIRAVIAGELPGFQGEFECVQSAESLSAESVGAAGCASTPCFYQVRVSLLEVAASLSRQLLVPPTQGTHDEANTSELFAQVPEPEGEAQEFVGHAMVACEDVTERRRAQDEREALARRQAAAQAAREQEKRGRERSEFLARAGEVLAASLDLDTTLEQTANLCVPFLADWCLIDLVEGEAFRRVAITFAEEEHGLRLPEEELKRRSEVSSTYRRLFSIYGDVKFGAAHVIRSGQSELFPLITEEILQHAAFDEEHLKMLRDLTMYSAMCIPLSTRGRTLGALSFVRSRTHISAAQLEGHVPPPASYTEEDLKLVQDVARVAALAVDNARLYGQAEAANRAKDDFLAVLSHELRTPLTPILGWVYLLREEKPAEEVYNRALDIIETNARAQGRLIEDLIDVSRVVTGKLSLEKRSVQLSRLVLDVVDAVRPHAAEKGLSLGVEAPDVGQVLGDEGRLRQAMNNLLLNAIKFTASGGRVEVRLEEGQGTARFVVSDTGRGIEPQFLTRLFERFEQADASSSRGEGGLGLGLTIVRHIARLHGGEVWASSQGPGLGAQFTLELPLLPPPSLANSLNSAPPLSIEDAKVLVADDEPHACELLETMLTRAGAVVRTVSNSEQAWKVFVEWRPDIVIFDLAMPGEDGYALIRRVRALPSHDGGQVPALAVTAHARPEDRQRALECGFHLHVAKPIDPAKLALAVLELLTLSR